MCRFQNVTFKAAPGGNGGDNRQRLRKWTIEHHNYTSGQIGFFLSEVLNWMAKAPFELICTRKFLSAPARKTVNCGESRRVAVFLARQFQISERFIHECITVGG